MNVIDIHLYSLLFKAINTVTQLSDLLCNQDYAGHREVAIVTFH